METIAADYASAWENLRLRRLTAWVVPVLIPLFYVAMVTTSGAAGVHAITTAMFGLSFAGAVLTRFWLGEWPCPRCGRPFFESGKGWWGGGRARDNCAHCHLVMPTWAPARRQQPPVEVQRRILEGAGAEFIERGDAVLVHRDVLEKAVSASVAAGIPLAGLDAFQVTEARVTLHSKYRLDCGANGTLTTEEAKAFLGDLPQYITHLGLVAR